MNKRGKFVISLDFELMWGVRDKRTVEDYGENLLGVWEALPKMLAYFEKYNIKATFATVGFLFASSKEELLLFCPQSKPNYRNAQLSPYNEHFELLKEAEDKYHFASELVEHIRKYPNQEIATHTFSHYYCLEAGQTKENFKEDILAAIEIARHKGIDIKSLVFPRNQFNSEYIEVIKNLGITSYRGNERVWFHSAANQQEENLIRRAFRLLDSYVNISGHNCYSIADIVRQDLPFDIPSSRFLRPYSSKLKFFEQARLRRILKSMTYAAQQGKIYHLWWHPHNFGINIERNFSFLDKILMHYQTLKTKYDFESITMNELAIFLQNTKTNK
ncbi:polysaccharide deacetylase family protein [Hugenholtzia roseola]|uniref:polysaccharide deacetylase family protein n=1 Tax=Hugenholtzia roseola TaxID=1002 RepID=UPI0004093EDD|nr:polysaccharide deacetylase family protein [Hugenholtzia roseola]